MREEVVYNIAITDTLKQRLLEWSSQFDEVLWLDSNNYEHLYSSCQAILAVEAFTSIVTDAHDAFQDLETYQSTTQDWIFGYLGYDLKNDIELLRSNNPSQVNVPDLCFFQPSRLIFVEEDRLVFRYLNCVSEEIETDYQHIIQYKLSEIINKTPVVIQQELSKETYIARVQQMKEYIAKGDIYEANFCKQFYATQVNINPYQKYKQLNAISKAPFASFFAYDDLYVLCSSPERFLRKQQQKLITQPIKGTAKRSVHISDDASLANQLYTDQKERSENIMIVDLVRNDLSKVASKGSVKVEEFCKVYSFKQVHQMISTVTCELASEFSPVDAIKACYPMGSMTGAPKLSAMKIIDKLETFKRGIYSGAIGYFTPEGDFDFNVVIRSIIYDRDAQKISFAVGSAITEKANPESEYEECLLKANALKDILSN